MGMGMRTVTRERLLFVSMACERSLLHAGGTQGISTVAQTVVKSVEGLWMTGSGLSNQSEPDEKAFCMGITGSHAPWHLGLSQLRS